MSAASRSSLQQSGIAEALDECLGELGQRPLGRVLGIAGSTLGRWGCDLHAWSFDAGLRVAREQLILKTPVLAYLNDDMPVRGEPIRLTQSVFALITEAASVIHKASEDLADGRMDRQEAKDLLPSLRKLYEHLGRSVIPTCEAAAQ